MSFILITDINQAIRTFKQLSLPDRLVLLWLVYQRLRRAITPAARHAVAIADDFFSQVGRFSRADQLEALYGLITGRTTLISREYDALPTDAKLAVWYRLAQGVDDGVIQPIPSYYKLSDEGARLFAAIEQLDFEQQLGFLRGVILPDILHRNLHRFN
jgi:hypothetical protein